MTKKQKDIARELYHQGAPAEGVANDLGIDPVEVIEAFDEFRDEVDAHD